MGTRRLDPDRLAVQTYEEAREWLWRYSRVEDWLWDSNSDLPHEARLVCAVFWVNPSDLVRDLAEDVRGIYEAIPRKRSFGWGR